MVNEVNEAGEIIKDDILLIIVNSYWEPIGFTLPNTTLGHSWEVLVDTNNNNNNGEKRIIEKAFNMPPRALLLLKNIR